MIKSEQIFREGTTGAGYFLIFSEMFKSSLVAAVVLLLAQQSDARACNLDTEFDQVSEFYKNYKSILYSDICLIRGPDIFLLPNCDIDVGDGTRLNIRATYMKCWKYLGGDCTVEQKTKIVEFEGGRTQHECASQTYMAPKAKCEEIPACVEAAK